MRWRIGITSNRMSVWSTNSIRNETSWSIWSPRIFMLASLVHDFNSSKLLCGSMLRVGGERVSTWTQFDSQRNEMEEHTSNTSEENSQPIDSNNPTSPLRSRKENKKSDDEGSAFDCNICLDAATEPVVTMCGHLFWWVIRRSEVNLQRS